MSIVPQEYLDRVTVSEGIRRTKYLDTRGYETIGIGHRLDRPLPLSVCDFLLVEDSLAIEREVLDALPWVAHLDDVRRWTIIELAFNMELGAPGGKHGLLSFGPPNSKTLTEFELGHWYNAAAGFRNSRWSDEVGPDRTMRICQQIETGEWS